MIVFFYLAGMIALSVYLGKNQNNNQDYYLGGKQMPWWAIGLSTMATQCSTNSLLGAPAFVAFAIGGGMVWLQYEIAVPLAMIFLMIFLLPFYRRANVISIYEYLEDRFGPVTRTLLSLVFQFMRAFSTGVTVYGISLVLAKLVNIPFWAGVVLLGLVTIIYDSIGGMKAVVYSDVIQMIVLYGGIAIAIGYAVKMVGGWGAVWENFDPQRRIALDFSSWGFQTKNPHTFWPLFFGCLFLYISYYGCDQTQVQRELSAANEDDTNLSLTFNGFVRFPLVLTYCFLGACIAAFAKLNPNFIHTFPLTKEGTPNINMAVPMFVLQYLPHGIIGLVMIALFAAAMSSLDSTINSLSATTMRDIYQRFINPQLSGKKEFLWGKIFTIFWGTICCLFSFFVGSISESIIESIAKIGSLMNGPILGAFVLGILIKRSNGQGAVSGVIGGLVLNIYLWLYQPQISFWWWNVFGCLGTIIIGWLISFLFPPPPITKIENLIYSKKFRTQIKYKINWYPVYWLLFLWTIAIIGIIAIF